MEPPIKTTTPTQVFKMNSRNFAALYTNLPRARQHFIKIMKEDVSSSSAVWSVLPEPGRANSPREFK
jgi:hypothetical protein